MLVIYIAENRNLIFFTGVRQVDPVLIVGAGLSAADAVLSARFRSLPIIHVFRRSNVSLDKTLPENMYPEYHKVIVLSLYKHNILKSIQ